MAKRMRGSVVLLLAAVPFSGLISGCEVVQQTLRTLDASGGGVASTSAAAGVAGPAVVLSAGSVRAGGSGKVVAGLATGGKAIAGAQNDITFAAGVRIAATGSGKPDCKVNPRIDKSATAFAFTPSGCKGKSCSGMRAIVLSMNNVKTIANGAELYSCKLTVAGGTAAGSYRLGNTKVALSDPKGQAIQAKAVAATVTVP